MLFPSLFILINILNFICNGRGGSRGGGKINRKCILLVMALFSLVLTSNVIDISAAADNQTDDLNTNFTQYSTQNSSNTTTQGTLNSSEESSSVNNSTAGNVQSSSNNQNSTSNLTYTNPSSSNNAAGEPSISFTVDEIKVAASSVRSYVESHGGLPDSVLIGGTKVSMAQFLSLLVTATLQINSGDNSTISLRNYVAPGNLKDSIGAGSFPVAEYLSIANAIKNYMDSSGSAPSYAYQTSLGTYLRFENLVYMYSMVLDSCGSSGKLAGFVSMKPWSIVVSSPVIGRFTVDEIKVAASSVRSYVESHGGLPDSVLVGGTQVTMAQFLSLLVTATLQINNGNNSTISLRNYAAPSNPKESIVAGNIPLAEYLSIANAIKNYMDSSGSAPSYAYPTSLGTYLRFENFVYMYAMVMDYYNNTGKIASVATMKPWSVVISSKIGTFTIDQIKVAASTLRTYIVANNLNLPNSVTVGSTQVTMAQFLELLVTATLQINNGDNSTISLRDFTAPGNPKESIVAGNIPKSEYLSIANAIKNYMENNGRAPDFAYQTSLGTYMRFENLVYMYAMIMDYYNTSGGKIADYAGMKPWRDPNAALAGIMQNAAAFGYCSGVSTAAAMEQVGAGDCWAMSEYLYQRMTAAGMHARIIQYANSYTSNHRSVQYVQDGSWIDAPYRAYGVNSMFNNTSSTGAVIAEG